MSKTKDRLTDNDIQSVIVKEEYTKMGSKTCVGCFTLANGFEIVTSSSCVNPENFDLELGKKYCRQHAINKIWELEGYRLQQRRHENNE